MENLSNDLILRVILYLKPSEIARMCSVEKRFFQISHDEYLWRNICESAGTPSLYEALLRANRNHAYTNIPAYRSLARRLEACTDMKGVKWLKLHYQTHNSGPRLEKMEAHTATTFLDRFVVVIGGWCDASDNGVHVIDASVLDSDSADSDTSAGSPLPLVTLVTFTQNMPNFRYGFSTTEYQGRLLVMGGCRGGGYSHDCNDVYFVDLRFDQMDESGQKKSFYPNRQFALSVGDLNHSLMEDLRQENEQNDPFADCASIKSHPPGTNYEVHWLFFVVLLYSR